VGLCVVCCVKSVCAHDEIRAFRIRFVEGEEKRMKIDEEKGMRIGEEKGTKKREKEREEGVKKKRRRGMAGVDLVVCASLQHYWVSCLVHGFQIPSTSISFSNGYCCLTLSIRKKESRVYKRGGRGRHDIKEITL
jgi:hypothetical protein